MEQKEDMAPPSGGREGETSNPDFIKWFSELDRDSGNIVGGKGANLAEIYNLKLPVPPGFVVTAQAYNYFIEKAGIKERISEILSQINYEDTQQLEESTKQIRELILNSEIPQEMKEDILEAYEHLNAGKITGGALNVLKKSSNELFVAVRSSATTEDLAEASFAGQQDSFVNVKGNEDLLLHIKKCFSSLFTSRATYYRQKKGFKHEQSYLAVVVQKMVDSYKSGVIFSKDPAHHNENTIIEAVWGLGEGIVSGKITPDIYLVSNDLEILKKTISEKKIAITKNEKGEKEIVNLNPDKTKAQVLTNYEIKKLTEYALTLEKHYQKPQDIEFAIENEEIYIVQTRPITTMEKRFKDAKEIKGEVVLSGIPASPGISFGKIKIINKMQDLVKIQKGDVLVTKMTNPDMVVAMQKSAAIVTDEGGMTSHAAIVSREMGIPAIVGTQEATIKLKEGEVITVDGFSGKVYKGKVSETVQKQVLPIVKTKTKIKTIVDLPSFAERASKSQIREVGLTRVEGIIAESGKHPNYYVQNKNMQDYEKIIATGINGIAKYFDEIWVRTSDLRSDEYGNLEGAPKEKEANPMLGMHGIRHGLKNPEILKAELKALQAVAKQGKKIGLILPQIISVEEVQKTKKILQEIGFTEAKVGVMIETPASVQIIRELCEEKISFISFGTNDLTQYTLAIDRNNEDVQYLHNEMHPAILHQIETVIKVCKEFNVETSICGQAGSKKEMVKFLISQGINSISVNADMAQEISKYVAQLESGSADAPDVEGGTKFSGGSLPEKDAETKVSEDKEVVNKEEPDKTEHGKPIKQESESSDSTNQELTTKDNSATQGAAITDSSDSEDDEDIVYQENSGEKPTQKETKVAPSDSNSEELTIPQESATQGAAISETPAEKKLDKEIEEIKEKIHDLDEEVKDAPDSRAGEPKEGGTQEENSSKKENKEEVLDIF